MKRAWMLFWFLCLAIISIPAQADMDIVSADSLIMIECQLYDSLGQTPVTAESGDSVTVDVWYVNGASMVGDSIPYTTASSEVSIVNGLLIFSETFGDIDGAGGDGTYIVNARFTDVNAGYSQTKQLIVTVGNYATIAELAAVTSDSTWKKDTTGFYDPGHFGYEAVQVASTGLTLSAIADAIWNEDTTGHHTPGLYGYEATGAGTSPWNSTQRDSVLAAVGNTAMHYKIWAHNTTRALTELDEDNTTMDLNATTVGALSGIIFPTNFTDLAITSTTGRISVGTNYDKIGYTASTVSDKTGYSLSAAGIDAFWDEAQSGHTTGGTFGYYLDAQVSGVGGGNISSAQRDSIMGYTRRAATALNFPCDSSFVREYPVGSKPKDSICVYCITDLGGGVTDTVKTATFYSYIHNKSISTDNVLDSLGAQKK